MRRYIDYDNVISSTLEYFPVLYWSWNLLFSHLISIISPALHYQYINISQQTGVTISVGYYILEKWARHYINYDNYSVLQYFPALLYSWWHVLVIQRIILPPH